MPMQLCKLLFKTMLYVNYDYMDVISRFKFKLYPFEVFSLFHNRRIFKYLFRAIFKENEDATWIT